MRITTCRYVSGTGRAGSGIAIAAQLGEERNQPHPRSREVHDDVRRDVGKVQELEGRTVQPGAHVYGAGLRSGAGLPESPSCGWFGGVVHWG